VKPHGCRNFFGFLLAVFLLFCLTALAKGARTVKQYEKGLITRLGKYHGMAPSGLSFIMPFVDDIVRVDMREQVITVPPQKLITKDNVTVEVDAVVYYKVIDPVKSQYEVQDFGYACTTLAQTNLRNLIGDRTLDRHEPSMVARDNVRIEACRDEPRGFASSVRSPIRLRRFVCANVVHAYPKSCTSYCDFTGSMTL